MIDTTIHIASSLSIPINYQMYTKVQTVFAFKFGCGINGGMNSTCIQKKDIKSLAIKIADELFFNGEHQAAHRLRMVDSNNRDQGGWCQAAVRAKVEERLRLELGL